MFALKRNDKDNKDITRIFGQLNTSSQYNSDNNNEASGRNGLGAKLVNIMAETFAI